MKQKSPERALFVVKLSANRSYSFSKKSHAEQEIYTPPGVPRSRSLTRFTMRVGLEHLGQSVLLLVSMNFLRSPVLAIFAIMLALPGTNVSARALDVFELPPSRASRIESSGTSRKDCPGLGH